MNCDEFGVKYLKYHFGELDEFEALDFKKHLEGCEACRAAYEEVVRLLEDVSGLDIPELPADRAGELKNAVLVKAAAKRKRQPFAIKRSNAAALLAAGVLILVCVAALLISVPSRTTSDTIKVAVSTAPETAGAAQETAAETEFVFDFEIPVPGEDPISSITEFSAWLANEWAGTGETGSLETIDEQIERLDEIIAMLE